MIHAHVTDAPTRWKLHDKLLHVAMHMQEGLVTSWNQTLHDVLSKKAAKPAYNKLLGELGRDSLTLEELQYACVTVSAAVRMRHGTCVMQSCCMQLTLEELQYACVTASLVQIR